MKLDALYSGKAKTIFKTDNPQKLIMEFRDSLTAFDGKKKSTAPKKGYYNARISEELFRLLEEGGIKTHFDSMLSDTEMVVDAVEIIKIEVIVRNIAAGSLIRKYPFKPGQKLDPPILLLDYKSDEYSDPMINDDIALALGLATREELLKIRELALRINSILVEYLNDRDLLLPDFKLEFGRRNGDIVLADEISCDTCRFWDKMTGESLDKDVFRYDKGDLASAYREVARRIVPGISL
ncbi:MAG: phosphoribosylaminoimidazolesuccinocarboxamide synthase [Candidatus Methanoperedens sp.]|uniref:phosphoribosylaminoimidazolesuccinocarboxamide synthase n=1 Tax=Candidatus Methanoperedens nitratireducens TaxID=1392998 RepID=UPI0009DE4464|nr:phosphoribosylaminoimidazolesuccinocarboxamide synthase [Candidatus Methanoperedens nitroreducens]MDJ1421274.1 phosphoribosylaminoimidazolesuccinocarboxamide synthase [Candidatus Methanoperedens sp.]